MRPEIRLDFIQEIGHDKPDGSIPCSVIPISARYRPCFWVWKIFLQRPICTEVWFDELRLSNLNDQGGYAANGRVDIKIADLGTLYLSAKTQSVGFGSIDQSINERALSSTTQLDAATQLELGKLLPRNHWDCPFLFMAAVSKSKSTPEYDPYDLDIKLAR